MTQLLKCLPHIYGHLSFGPRHTCKKLDTVTYNCNPSMGEFLEPTGQPTWPKGCLKFSDRPCLRKEGGRSPRQL